MIVGVDSGKRERLGSGEGQVDGMGLFGQHPAEEFSDVQVITTGNPRRTRSGASGSECACYGAWQPGLAPMRISLGLVLMGA
jgi:hypothetical protein